MAKNNHNLYTYHIEKYRVLFKIKTNSDTRVNRILLFIEITSFIWSIVGTVELNVLPSKSGSNAMMDCLRDYGVNTVLMAFVFLMISWFQFFRFLIVAVCIVYHQKILGWLERRYRNDAITTNSRAD